MEMRCYDAGGIRGEPMAGHNKHSTGRVEVTVTGIRDEAKKWYRLSDSMQAVFGRISTANVSLFSVADPATMFPLYPVDEEYADSHNEYTGLINRAYEEFAALGDALNKCADGYEETDGKATQSFDDFATS